MLNRRQARDDRPSGIALNYAQESISVLLVGVWVNADVDVAVLGSPCGSGYENAYNGSRGQIS